MKENNSTHSVNQIQNIAKPIFSSQSTINNAKNPEMDQIHYQNRIQRIDFLYFRIYFWGYKISESPKTHAHTQSHIGRGY